MYFKTRQCSCTHHLGVQNIQNLKNKKKNKCVCGHADKFWKGFARQLRKTQACKTVYIEFIFLPEKLCVFWRSFYEEYIQPTIQMPSPPLLPGDFHLLDALNGIILMKVTGVSMNMTWNYYMHHVYHFNCMAIHIYVRHSDNTKQNWQCPPP